MTDTGRTAVWVTVGLIVGTVLVSGPLVRPIDFTGHSERIYCEASGSASVNLQDVTKEAFTMEPAGTNEEYYSVTGPPFKIDVGDIEGCPVLTLKLTISELGFKSIRKSYLAAGDGPQIRLTVVGGEFSPERITERSYAATLSLRLAGTENRTLYNQTTNVEVVE